MLKTASLNPQLLQSLDTIVFRFLNLERATMLAESFVARGTVHTPEEMAVRWWFRV
jgi:hypothetical protein